MKRERGRETKSKRERKEKGEGGGKFDGQGRPSLTKKVAFFLFSWEVSFRHRKPLPSSPITIRAASTHPGASPSHTTTLVSASTTVTVLSLEA